MYYGSDIVLGTGFIKVKLVLSTSVKYENKEVPCRGPGVPMEVDHRVAGGGAGVGSRLLRVRWRLGIEG